MTIVGGLGGLGALTGPIIGAILLVVTPHKGSIRDEIAPGLRAIPAGRKAVIAFAVDDKAGEILVHAVTYGGTDWMARARSRHL